MMANQEDFPIRLTHEGKSYTIDKVKPDPEAEPDRGDDDSDTSLYLISGGGKNFTPVEMVVSDRASVDHFKVVAKDTISVFK